MPTRDYVEFFIKIVDEDFTHRRGTFQAYVPLLFAGFLLIPANYVWVNYIRTGVSTDTILLGVTLVITADFFAISLMLTMESGDRIRRIYASQHYLHLLKLYPDHLILIALIRMRANLAKGITLRSVYDSDPSLFTKEKLMQRAIEPLP